MMRIKQLFLTLSFSYILFIFVLLCTAYALEPTLLKGKWIRPDGGYVIEFIVKEQETELIAKYYNPRSIHVEKTEVFEREGTLEVFIELQDMNYPGSTYRLSYNPEKDILEGFYFQAVDRVEYQIYFERAK